MDGLADASEEKWIDTEVEDDADVFQTASTAVLVAFDLDTNQGKKQARLFNTRTLADAIVAAKIGTQ